MAKKYRLAYFKNGVDSLREKLYPTLLDAKTNIPCVFKFKPDGIHNNKEHFKIFEEEIDANNNSRIISTHIYLNKDYDENSI